MKIRYALAAGSLALTLAAIAPALAQNTPPSGMQPNTHGPMSGSNDMGPNQPIGGNGAGGMQPNSHGPGGNMGGSPPMGGDGSGGMMHGDAGSTGGRGPGMGDATSMEGNSGRHEMMSHHGSMMRRHCRTVWRHHHRIRRCS